MKCRSKQIWLSAEKENSNAGRYMLYAKPAFSLVEAVTALIILALISSSVLVVINRCMASATDSVLRMQAFEVARANMEALLSQDLVGEIVEYGSSYKYPEITWQTAVETFYEPITQRVWVRGVCSAEYTDTSGQTQSVELTHWLTDITKQQLLEFLRRQQEEQALLAEQVIETIEEAAGYAGVDVRTFEQWVDNGLLTTEDGSFIKDNIDIFKQSDGNPSPEAKNQQVESVEDITKPTGQKTAETESDEQKQSDVKLICGYTMEELMQMDFDQVWEIIWNCDEF